MEIKQTLKTIVLAGVIGFSGCFKQEVKPKYRNISGKVYRLDQKELIYLENGCKMPISITFLEIEAKNKRYQIILTGPHNLRQKDFISLDYLIDNEVTGKEIWDRFYSDRTNPHYFDISKPNVRFKVDGYAIDWKKE